MLDRKKFIFTFGSGQKHENGYVIVWADNSKNARQLMFDNYDMQWSMEYDSEESAGVDRWRLHLVGVLSQN